VWQNLGTTDLRPVFGGQLIFNHQDSRLKLREIAKTFHRRGAVHPSDFENVFLGVIVESRFEADRFVTS